MIIPNLAGMVNGSNDESVKEFYGAIHLREFPTDDNPTVDTLDGWVFD